MRFTLFAFLGVSFAASTGVALGNAIGRTEGGYSVSPTGAAKYSIPIVVPPGIAGLAPRLALEADSRSGNGYVGMRFGISGLSQITRCPSNPEQDGMPYDGANFNSDDRFCLDGQRLVSGNYGGVGAEYRTEIESFRKIVSVGNVDGTSGDPEYFVSKDKSGLTYTYGGSLDSRVVRPGGNPNHCNYDSNGNCVPWHRRAYRWLLSRIEDRAGNYIEFTYQAPSPEGEVVPFEVNYAANSGAGISPQAKVRFVYRPRSGLAPIGYLFGHLQAHTVLLDRIETYAGTALARSYQLQYEITGSAQREVLTSVQECAGSLCFNPTRFTWYPDDETLSYSSDAALARLGSTWKQFVADWDADGRQDIIAVNHGTSLAVRVYRSLPTGGFSAIAQSFANPPSNSGNATVLVSDFNGDGRADLAVARHAAGNLSYFVTFASATGFSAASTQTIASALSEDATDIFAGDTNGDDRKDVVLVHASPTAGTQIQAFTTDSANVLTPTQALVMSGASPGGEQTVKSGDFNRDGLMDVAVIYNGGTNGLFVTTYQARYGRYYLGGSSFPVASMQSGGNFSVLDINGDGNQDLVHTYAPGLLEGPRDYSHRILLSDGAGRFAQSYGSSGTWSDFTLSPIFGDFNGDGLGDIGWITFNQVNYNVTYVGGLGLQVFFGTSKGELGAWAVGTVDATMRHADDLPQLPT
jgi:hypothetical protein